MGMEPSGKDIVGPLHRDKALMYRELHRGIERLNSHHKLNGRQYVELCLASGLVNSTKRWVEVVGKEWCTEKNRPDFDRSLLIQYIDFCRKNYGSVMGGEYMRFVPSYNKSTSEKELTKACCLFYDVCSSLNNSNNSRELTDYEVMEEFAAAVKAVEQCMSGLGALSSQHVLQVAVLLGLVDRPEFTEHAVISRGTNCHKAIKNYLIEEHGITENQAKGLLEDKRRQYVLLDSIAKDQKVSKMVAENILCKAFGDDKEQKKQLYTTESGAIKLDGWKGLMLHAMDGNNRSYKAMHVMLAKPLGNKNKKQKETKEALLTMWKNSSRTDRVEVSITCDELVAMGASGDCRFDELIKRPRWNGQRLEIRTKVQQVLECCDKKKALMTNTKETSRKKGAAKDNRSRVKSVVRCKKVTRKTQGNSFQERKLTQRVQGYGR
jgi:hypothetical protein